jgi:hypothetical protein
MQVNEYVTELDAMQKLKLVGVDNTHYVDGKGSAIHHDITMYIENDKRERTLLSSHETHIGIVDVSAHDGSWIKLPDYARVNQNYRIIYNNEVAPSCEIVMGHNPKAQTPYATWTAYQDKETQKWTYEDPEYQESRTKAKDSLNYRTAACSPIAGLTAEQEKKQLQDKLTSLGDVIFPISSKGDVVWPIEALNQLSEQDRQRIKILFFSPRTDISKPLVPAIPREVKRNR